MERTQRSLRCRSSDYLQKNVLTQKTANAKHKMGTKAPSNKVKSDNICDVCEMKFLTVQALRSHRNAKHANEKVDSPELDPKATPKNTPAASARVSKRLQLLKKGIDTEESENSDQNMEDNKNKIWFSCPVCPKLFSISFQASKHIQKKHCVDCDGNAVSADSPDLIKPVTVEVCPHCKERVDSSHNCNKIASTASDQFTILHCLGCETQFPSITTFNRHSSHIHRDQVDSMFFKTMEEFSMWKQVMETQVKIKYLELKKSVSQRYYQCNFVSTKNDSTKTYLCPSVIVARDLPHVGTQIHYYMDHYGHTTPKYQLPEEFFHYLTSRNEAKTEVKIEDVIDPDENLCNKLRNLLESIREEAVKLSIPQLRKLYKTALGMQNLLKKDLEQEDDTSLRQNMTDDQISDALEGKRTSARLKRKSESRVSVDTKKKKDEKSDGDNVDSKPIKNESKTVSKENKGIESPRVKTRSSPLLSPSFNDSYRQFIGTTKPEPAKQNKSNKRKEIVKTKIGQFSPKNKPTVEETEESKPNILKPSKINTPLIKDIKYEVREQENDCNILILKI